MSQPDNSGDFLDRLGVSPTLRAIVERSAEEYERTGDWATFDSLAYDSAERDVPYNLNEVFRLPSAIGGVWTAEKVQLTGLGVLLAGSAPRTAEMMVRLVEICAARKRRLRDDAKIGQQILTAEYGFLGSDARKAQSTIELLPGVSGSGSLGDDWSLSIFRGALDYRDVRTVDDLRQILEDQAIERMRLHEQSLAAAPAFAPGGIFSTDAVVPAISPTPIAEPRDTTSVFVVHGRDYEAKAAMWGFLRDLGLHPLDWEDDLIALTGQGSPYVGQILDAAFGQAQAVVILITPDDVARLHVDLVQQGERPFESELTGQPRPNVLFEAGMAFGFNPSRTILVEIGTLRPVSDLGGRHTVRIGNADRLRDLARRLEAAGCQVDRSGDAWLDIE